MITLKRDGTIEPFGLAWLDDSTWDLLAPTDDNIESIWGADGSFDFGSSLKTGSITLRCKSTDGLTEEQKAALKTMLAGQLYALREYDLLVWETDPEKGLPVRLGDKPAITEKPGGIVVEIPLVYRPFWVGTTEHVHTGSGTITNAGTAPTPAIIEIAGQVTDPSVKIGAKSFTITGALSSLDIVVVDTEKMTVSWNEVPAIDRFSGDFPWIDPGETIVEAASVGITTIKWKDRWI